MVRIGFSFAMLCLFVACNNPEKTFINTVRGPVEMDSIGITLIHEHLLVDFIGTDSTGYHRWNRDSVIQKALPYLLEAKQRGVQTFIDCTPAYLGRDPSLLSKLSELSDINIITNTGYYGAVQSKYLPAHAFAESASQLAERWKKELDESIEASGIYPGFIKISVNSQTPLSTVDQKLVKAAAITHLSTGLTIASHTGPAEPALEELAILQSEGVSPSAFIWVHAQAEEDFSYYNEAHKLGAWISLDGVAWDVNGHLERLLYCKQHKLLDKVLISHDAGWYKPGEMRGGEFKPFTAIFDELIPLLQQNGFTEKDIDHLLRVNPIKAFSPSVRKGN